GRGGGGGGIAGETTVPPLARPQQAAKLLGLAHAQIRHLIRERRPAHVVLCRPRFIIPPRCLQQIIFHKTGTPFQNVIPAPTSASSTNAAATTSPGPSAAARGSAARAQQIANKLKSRSPNSSTSEPAALAHVIPLKR